MKLRLSYYHCRCGAGQKPWDRQLRLTAQALTPAAAQVVAQAGVLASFADAAEKTLPTLCGLRVSESTVERTTEAAGQRRAEQLTAGQPSCPVSPWRWQRDAQGRRCAYVGLDATGVRQQGPGGARADGRMAAVGLIYNPRSAHDMVGTPPRQVRFLAGFYTLDEIGRQLRAQAEQVGWLEADQQIALSDGGAGLEEVLGKFFPRAECILDFWHAKEHLVQLAQAFWPHDETARRPWLDARCQQLKHQGGRAVLETLETMELADQPASVRDEHRRQTQYFRNHAHRMDYPRYLAQGWQIGSGPVESACKTVVGNRLKGGGMRWGHDGANAVCYLRALYLSQPELWQAFWSQHPN